MRTGWLLPLLLVWIGCIDPDDYGDCLEKADNRRTLIELCVDHEQGTCPESHEPEVRELFDEQLCGTEVAEVVCGPHSELPTESSVGRSECCYVVRATDEKCP